MRTRQKCVATDTWRSLGCRTSPLEHWSRRKPTVEPRWAKQQTKKLRPKPTKIERPRICPFLKNNGARHIRGLISHIYGASSPLFFRNGQILGLSPIRKSGQVLIKYSLGAAYDMTKLWYYTGVTTLTEYVYFMS